MFRKIITATTSSTVVPARDMARRARVSVKTQKAQAELNKAKKKTTELENLTVDKNQPNPAPIATASATNSGGGFFSSFFGGYMGASYAQSRSQHDTSYYSDRQASRHTQQATDTDDDNSSSPSFGCGEDSNDGSD